MEIREYDIVIIGGGPAGMAAAIAAYKAGIKKVVILEQQPFLGGVLPQCIHDGFGLHLFKQNMTGPEYAAYYRRLINELKIEYHLSATVMEINGKREVTCVGKTLGAVRMKAGAVILAMGCKERSRGALRIPGTRPAGIYTAGAAQHMMNIQNYKPGKSVVILGLGDIGLIMARRLTLEGVRVKLILGIEANGLQRNMVQCVRDYDIRLLCGYTVISIHGVKRLKGVTIAKVETTLNDTGNKTETIGEVAVRDRQYIPCDTLLLAAGLVSDTEIASNAGRDGIFVCGNASEVHDLVDFVTIDGEKAGLAAAAYLKRKNGGDILIPAEREHENIWNGKELKGSPDLPEDTGSLKYRICILCPRGCRLKGSRQKSSRLEAGFGYSWEITGNQCERGREYGLQEILNPMRTVTTTVKINDDKNVLLPVKTREPVPKSRVMDVMKVCRKITVERPVRLGSVIASDVAGTGADLISCDEIL